jgi:nicotinamidase-related amidase
MRSRTYAYDNCKFFVPRYQGGQQLGSEGWVKITAKGRREYLPGIDPERSALVIVDMEAGWGEWAERIGRYNPTLADTILNRMDNVTVPNIARLLKFFRDHQMLVVYLTLGGPGIMPELAPDGEVVLRKYSAGAFATSSLDNVLREHGIATTFFVGQDTCACVDATMSGAHDRSYQTILVEDGCCSARPELHEAAVKVWAYKAFVRTTDQVIDDYAWQCWVDPGMADAQSGPW